MGKHKSSGIHIDIYVFNTEILDDKELFWRKNRIPLVEILRLTDNKIYQVQ